nr:PREDICTED: trichohyalin-like isoform X2 [Megachile rotundata]
MVRGERSEEDREERERVSSGEEGNKGEERRDEEKKKQKNLELEKRQRMEEEEIMKEFINFLHEKNMEGRFEEILKENRGKKHRAKSPEEEEDWNAVVTPPFDIYIDPKTRERVRRRAEKRNREAEIRKVREGKSSEWILWTERQRRDKEEMERVLKLWKEEAKQAESQEGRRKVTEKGNELVQMENEKRNGRIEKEQTEGVEKEEQTKEKW